jgi:hypothetical protein
MRAFSSGTPKRAADSTAKKGRRRLPPPRLAYRIASSRRAGLTRSPSIGSGCSSPSRRDSVSPAIWAGTPLRYQHELPVHPCASFSPPPALPHQAGPVFGPFGPCQTGYKSPAPHLFLTQSVEYVNLLSEHRTSLVSCMQSIRSARGWVSLDSRGARCCCFSSMGLSAIRSGSLLALQRT